MSPYKALRLFGLIHPLGWTKHSSMFISNKHFNIGTDPAPKNIQVLYNAFFHENIYIYIYIYKERQIAKCKSYSASWKAKKLMHCFVFEKLGEKI